MIEEIGEVIAITGDQARVARTSGVRCNLCQAAGQCGSSMLPILIASRRQPLLDAWNPVDARVGDRVVVGISEQTLQRASWIVFLWPLFGLLGLAIAVDRLWGHGSAGELVTISGGIFGLVVGLAVARNQSERLLGNFRCHAQVLRIAHGEQEQKRLSREPAFAVPPERQ